MKKAKYQAIRIFLLVSLCLLCFCELRQKDNLHKDEVYNYELANGTDGWNVCIEDEKSYAGGELFFEKMVVHPEKRFTYSDVWANQASDTHPPFYYAVLHTLCSVFAGKFSIWFAGGLNILFLLGIALLTEKIALFQFQKKEAGLLAMLLVILSGGMVQAATFLRMYVMAMFLGMCILYWHIKAFHKEGYSWLEILALIAATVSGVLTHYYVIIFVVLEAVFYAGRLLMKKRWKALGQYCGALLAAAGAALLIFPAMWEHVLGSNGRSVEAFNNLKNAAYVERLKKFFEIIGGDLFGLKTIAVLVIGLVVIFLVLFVAKKLPEPCYGVCIENILCILLPSVLYFLIVAKIAAYMTGRYIWLIYPMCIYFIFSVLYIFSQKVVPSVEWRTCCLAVLILIMGTVSLQYCKWEYSYKRNPAVAIAKKLSAEECIYIYDGSHTYQCAASFMELLNYRSITFYEEKNIDKLKENSELKDKESFVVYTWEEEPEQILECILDWFPNVDGYQENSSNMGRMFIFE